MRSGFEINGSPEGRQSSRWQSIYLYVDIMRVVFKSGTSVVYWRIERVVGTAGTRFTTIRTKFNTFKTIKNLINANFHFHCIRKETINKLIDALWSKQMCLFNQVSILRINSKVKTNSCYNHSFTRRNGR